ncbi:glycosyltransferase family 39 protein [Undibacterium sp. SXout7W]|uniref:glycosyltransferase family 39 protein n=1 Tax=Undibacterium sp. SXout7W TaxID=3413049 RepID=UPI003BF14BC3
MEKPPLLYWLTAISFALFGESEWSARLVPALSSLSCVALILWFSKKNERVYAGRLAALMFISGLGVTAMSRTLMFDMLLTALLTASLMGAYFFLTAGSKKSWYWSLAMLALALLAKGFVAIILFSVVIGAYVVCISASVGDFFRRISNLFDRRALGIFCVIAVPWHMAAMFAEPVFAWFYFINEHILRFLGKREPHDYYAGAWWYYLPRMIMYLFPWSFFLPVLFFAKSNVNKFKPLQWFLAAAWIMPVLFFSLSSAKANYYLVVVMPVAALQLSYWLEDCDYGGRIGALITAMFLGGVLAGLLYWLQYSNQPWLDSVLVLGQSGRYFVQLCLGLMLVVTVVIGWLNVHWSNTFVAAYAIVPAILTAMLLQLVQLSSDWTSALPLAEELQNKQSERQVFFYKIFENKSSLPFYLKKTVNVLESRSSDLFWGDRLHRNDITWTVDKFVRLSEQKKIALIVMNQDIDDAESKIYLKQFRKYKKIGNATLFLN